MWDDDDELMNNIWLRIMKSILVSRKKGECMDLSIAVLGQLTNNFSKAFFDKILDEKWGADWYSTAIALYIVCAEIENCNDIFNINPETVVSQAMKYATDVVDWYWNWKQSYDQE